MYCVSHQKGDKEYDVTQTLLDQQIFSYFFKWAEHTLGNAAI